MSEKESAQQLVERARRGDRAAFGELAEMYRGRLEAIARSRLGPEAARELEVADVVQETFARALDSLESFQWQGEESFLRWLGGTAENFIAKTAKKRERRHALRLDEDIIAPGQTPEKGLRREERFDRLERALEGLPPDYREVIRLARIEGLKHEEIATRMNRSHAAVRQLMLRALRKLRERFGDTESLHLPDRALETNGERDG